MSTATLNEYFAKLKLPDPHSHKGQNGKLLIIGGSELFHAASRWSLDVASKLVDMVFYASVPSNNELIKEAKGAFWNGIVISRREIASYITEADVVLIGPGMTRAGEVQKVGDVDHWRRPLSDQEWDHDTARVTNYLLTRYPDKKWVVDAGALQMVDPTLLGPTCIITPHHHELERLENLYARHLGGLADESKVGLIDDVLNSSATGGTSKISVNTSQLSREDNTSGATSSPQHSNEAKTHNSTAPSSTLSQLLSQGITVLLKGPTDYIYQNSITVEVTGGNAGMTKGGTGDVLAGLVAGLYATNDALTSAVVASVTNKKAGEELAKTVGPFFNATDLTSQIPKILWELIG